MLSKDTLITKLADATAAGTTAVTATVDMLGYNEITFLGCIATVAEDNTVKLGQGDASDGSDAVDLDGVELTPDNETGTASVILDLKLPSKRYVTITFTRGTSTALGEVWAIQSSARRKPITNTGTTQFVSTSVIPAEEGN